MVDVRHLSFSTKPKTAALCKHTRARYLLYKERTSIVGVAHLVVGVAEMMENRFYCEHCGEKVSKTLYYQHKKLYYTVDKQQWKKTPDEEAHHEAINEDEDFTFSDHEDSLEVADEEGMLVDEYAVESFEDSDSDDDFDFDKVSLCYIPNSVY